MKYDRLISISLLFVFIGNITSSCYNVCEESSRIYSIAFKGVIEAKRVHSYNHGTHFLIINDQISGERITLDLTSDLFKLKESNNSFFWELVDNGDSISKVSGTFEVRFKKQDQEWNKRKLGFKLCEE